jgi:predicted transcriptional regulator YdeE
MLHFRKIFEFFMHQTPAQLPEIKLIGITCRTNNTNIFSTDPSTNILAATVQKYFHNGLNSKIPNRKKPGTTYCVYTNYESDFTGDYTYFIGEEVANFDGIAEGFETLTIPNQSYIKFTNESGPMPNVCINMWKDIWKMNAYKLGGERSYIADFEVYDNRAQDHNNVVLDIYIGVKKKTL